MKENYLTKICFLLLLLFSVSGYSQTCDPIIVTGFNFDGVAESVPAATTTTGPLDGSDHVLYSQAYGINTSVGYGLASSRKYSVGNTTYMLQPYNQNNMLRLTTGQTGAMTFSSPLSYSTISVLGFSTEGHATFNYTVNFTDGTTSTGSGVLSDWFYGYGSAFWGLGNINRFDTGGFHNGSDPRFFRHDITLTGNDQFKKISNITFAVTTTGSQRLHIMAVSGTSNIANDAGQCGATINYTLPNDNIIPLRVLLLGSVTVAAYLNDIQNNLISSGLFNTVDAINTNLSTPGLATLQQYDVVLIFSSNNLNNPVALGDALAQYIEGGGAVVDAYSDAAINFGALGQYDANYRVLVPGSFISGPTLTLGTVNLPSHSIMSGVSSFNGGTGSYRVTSNSITAGSYVVARYSNNDLFIVAKENVGPMHVKRATLNFFPGSVTAVPGSWDKNTTDGLKIITNTLKWVTSPYTQTAGLPSGSLFPIGTTTNTFTYYDEANVLQSYSFNIVVKDTELPTAIAKNITATLDATGSVTIAPADINDGSSDNCTLTLSLDKTSFNCSNIGTNTVTLTVTDPGGNTDTATAVVTVNSTLAASVGSQTDVLCHGQATGEATVNITGGSSSYTYSWNTNPVQTTATATGLAQGTYTVTVTDSNGCKAIQSFVITEPAASLVATAGTQTNVKCHGNATGSATVNVTGGTGAYSYSWNTTPVQTTATASNLIAGTYTVTVTDANLCTTTQSFTITEPSTAMALTPNTTQTDVLCNGQATGAATVAVNGGTGTYTYLWSNGGTTNTITNLIAGTYTVDVTDANGCVLSNSFTITEPTALTATAGPQLNVLCHGNATGQATVNVTGGTGAYSYSWNTTPVQTTATASNLIAGTYTVTVTDANLCTTTQAFTITEPTLLAATAGPQVNVLCHGNATGSATVNVTGGIGAYTYSWAPSGGSAATATGLVAGTYTVTVTDANLCTTTQSFTITEPLQPLTATAGPQVNVLCFGNATGQATVNAAGGTGAYTYSWAPSGGTAATATGLAAGTYTVTVTDANLCTTTQAFTITEPLQPLTLTPNTTQVNVLCNGQATGSATVAVNGGTGSYTYLWSNAQTTNTITGLTAGTYTVTVTDTNGCTLSNSYTITEPSALVATAGPQTDVLCFGNATGAATVNVTGGTGAYSYSWNTTPVQTTATATGLTAGTYTVTVFDANQCQTTQAFTITQPSQPLSTTPNTSHTNVSCFGGTNGSATIALNGGTAPYTYLWSNGQIAATATGLIAGTYTVTVTDANGCTLSQSFTITEPAALIASAGQQSDVTCFGAANGTAAVNVTGGTTPYTYSWNTSPAQSGAIASGLVPGTYTVTVTDINQCQATQVFTITEPQLLTAAVNNYADILCYGAATGSATVDVAGGTLPYSYVWNTGQTTATATGLTAGVYTVVVTDANGCHVTTGITLTQPAAPLHLTTSQVNVNCAADNTGSININATGGTGPYTYTWTPAVSTTSSAANLGVGNYNVVVTDANGCSDIRYLSIIAPTAVTGYFTVTNADCYTTGAAIVHASGGVGAYTYLWSNGSTTDTLENVMPGTYTVTITDSNGCAYTLSTTINGTDPIIITSQPQSVTINGGETAVFTVVAQNVNTYQWQVSTNGGQTFTNLNGGGSNPSYYGVTTPTLTVTNAYEFIDGYQYRVILLKQTGCYVLTDAGVLTVEPVLVGIDDVIKTEMSLYPNPASTEVFIKISDYGLLNDIKVAMYDLNGRVVRNEELITSENYRLDVSGLESATYIISITSNAGRTDKKVVIKK